MKPVIPENKEQVPLLSKYLNILTSLLYDGYAQNADSLDLCCYNGKMQMVF